MIASAFFIHESFPYESNELVEARNEWMSLRKESGNSLQNLKNSAKNTPQYIEYKNKKDKTNNALSKLNKAKNDNKFLQFKSIHQFMGEFGWALGLFLYSLVNLILSLSKETRIKKSKVIFHSTFMFIGCFYIRWLFLKEDYSTFQYIFTNLLCVLSLIFATHFFIKYKNSKDYKKPIKNLIKLIADIRANHYLKIARKAINSSNEELIIKDIEIVEKKINSTLLKVVEDTN